MLSKRQHFTLYYHAGATSLAPHVVLRELGLDFTLQRIDLNANEQRAEAFLEINPRGRVPVLAMGNAVLTETPAILAMLAALRPDARLLPKPGSLDHARALEWLSWLCSSVHISFAQIFFPERFSAIPAHAAALAAAGRSALESAFDDVENRLGRKWAVGDDFSVVDPYLLVFCRFANLIDADASRGRDRLSAWIERVIARKSVLAAMEAEGITMHGRAAQ